MKLESPDISLSALQYHHIVVVLVLCEVNYTGWGKYVLHKEYIHSYISTCNTVVVSYY